MRTRKGSLQDLPAQIVILFKLGVVLFSTYLIHDKLMQFSFFSGSVAMQDAKTALTVLDYGMVMITVGLFITSIYLASRIRTSKIFLPVSLIFLVISVWIAAVFSNVFAAIAGTSQFSAAASTLPFIQKILVNLPLLMLVSGTMIIVALYTRVSRGGGQRVAR